MWVSHFRPNSDLFLGGGLIFMRGVFTQVCTVTTHDHVTPLCQYLHWLKLEQWIIYGLCWYNYIQSIIIIISHAILTAIFQVNLC